MPSGSVCWWVLAGPQASRPVQTYENAVWVWCHLRISWSQLHIFQTFCSASSYTVTSLSCFHSTSTSYKFGPWLPFQVDFTVFILYITKMFSHFFLFVWLNQYRKNTCMQRINQLIASLKDSEAFVTLCSIKIYFSFKLQNNVSRK